MVRKYSAAFVTLALAATGSGSAANAQDHSSSVVQINQALANWQKAFEAKDGLPTARFRLLKHAELPSV
jgi:hypothetical protein